MIYSTALKTNQEPCCGISRGFMIEWQGKLYGPYANEKEMVADGFRFDGGEPLADPFRGK